jgi:hypothetical protein
MKEPTKIMKQFSPDLVVILLIISINSMVHAQQLFGLSVGSESSRHMEITAQDTSASHPEQRTDGWSFGAFPIIFYSDETRLAGGAGVQAVYKRESEQHSSTIGLIAFYTRNKQYVIQVAPELYLKQGNYKFSGGIAYLCYPDKFYGIGNNTSKDDEEDYTSWRFQFNPIVQKKIFSRLYVGFQYNFSYTKLTKTEAGKLLDKGIILGSEGGSVSGIGLIATYDSRDNNLYPTSGSYHHFSAVAYEPGLGSDFTYNSYLLDLRHYRAMFDKHILAFQGVIGINTGNPPFQSLNQLGTYLRGYYQSRFQDKNLMAVQAEYRLPLFGRFGLVGFAGCGQVAHEIEKSSLKKLKPSAGFGLRFALIPEQKVNLRIDFGFGKDDSSFDIVIMELF